MNAYYINGFTINNDGTVTLIHEGEGPGGAPKRMMPILMIADTLKSEGKDG